MSWFRENRFLGMFVIVVGVCTLADDALLRPGSSWFGHPPFELPNREVVEFDRRLTHEPGVVH